MPICSSVACVAALRHRWRALPLVLVLAFAACGVGAGRGIQGGPAAKESPTAGARAASPTTGVTPLPTAPEATTTPPAQPGSSLPPSAITSAPSSTLTGFTLWSSTRGYEVAAPSDWQRRAETNADPRLDLALRADDGLAAVTIYALNPQPLPDVVAFLASFMKGQQTTHRAYQVTAQPRYTAGATHADALAFGIATYRNASGEPMATGVTVATGGSTLYVMVLESARDPSEMASVLQERTNREQEILSSFDLLLQRR